MQRHALLFSELRDVLDDADRVRSVACVLGVNDDGEFVHELNTRARVLDRMRGIHGVCRELFAVPEEKSTLPAVVVAHGVISLHLLEVKHRRGVHLAVARRDIVAEPADQQHWTSGPWTVTRWTDPGDGGAPEVRYAWVPTPSEPENEEDLLRRLFAFYEQRIVRQLSSGLGIGWPSRELMALVYSTECCGNYVYGLQRRGQSLFTQDYPAIRRAIDEDTRDGHIPVFVEAERYHDRYATLRWLSVREDGLASDAPVGASVCTPVQVVNPDDTHPSWGPDRGFWSPPRQGIEGTIDRLVKLSRAELDATIVMAGFDPAIERSLGPGLRETVVRAIGAGAGR